MSLSLLKTFHKLELDQFDQFSVEHDDITPYLSYLIQRLRANSVGKKERKLITTMIEQNSVSELVLPYFMVDFDQVEQFVNDPTLIGDLVFAKMQSLSTDSNDTNEIKQEPDDNMEEDVAETEVDASTSLKSNILTTADAVTQISTSFKKNNSRSATRLFERGTAQHRMELLARALVLLSKCSIIEQQTLNYEEKALLDCVGTAIYAAECANAICALSIALPHIITMDVLIKGLIENTNNTTLCNTVALVYTMACNNPHQCFVETIIPACLRRLEAEIEPWQQIDVKRSYFPSDVELVLFRLLEKLACLSLNSARFIKNELTKFQLAPYVALRITCELLDGDLTANDAWLRPFVREYQNVSNVPDLWQQRRQAHATSTLRSAHDRRDNRPSFFGAMARRRERNTPTPRDSLTPRDALTPLSDQGSVSSLLDVDIQSKTDQWPVFAHVEHNNFSVDDDMRPPHVLASTVANEQSSTAFDNPILSFRQRLHAKLHDDNATTPDTNSSAADGSTSALPASQSDVAAVDSLHTALRDYCILFGVLGAKPTAQEANSLLHAVGQCLSMRRVSRAFQRDAFAFAMLAEGLLRLCDRAKLTEYLQLCCRSEHDDEERAFLPLLLSAHSAQPSAAVQTLTDALALPLSLHAESVRLMSELLSAALDERRAVARVVRLPANALLGVRERAMASSASVLYQFLQTGTFARVLATQQSDERAELHPAQWLWRLCASCDESNAGSLNSLNPLLPALIDEYVHFVIVMQEKTPTSGYFSESEIEQVVGDSALRDEMPSPRTSLLTYFVFKFNDEARMANDAKVDASVSSQRVFVPLYSDALLASLPVRAILRRTSNTNKSLNALASQTCELLRAVLIALVVRLRPQLLMCGALLDGQSLLLSDRGSSLVHVDKVRNLDDVLRLRHASMATCARVLPFVLNVFRKHVINSSIGLNSLLKLANDNSSLLARASVVFLQKIWPSAFDLSPERAVLLLCSVTMTDDNKQLIGGLPFDNSEEMHRILTLDDDNSASDDADDINISSISPSLAATLTADPLCVLTRANRRALAFWPLYAALLQSLEFFAIASRTHYGRPTKAVVSSTGVGSEVSTVDAVRHALIGLQESAIVQLVLELGSAAWLKIAFEMASLSLGDCSALQQYSCALLHRLYCEHPPLLALSLAHLADSMPSEHNENLSIDGKLASRACRESISMLCRRVPSIHIAAQLVRQQLEQQDFDEEFMLRLSFGVNLVAQLVLLPQYRLPHLLDLCGRICNRMLFGRGEKDTFFLNNTIVCLPSFCVAFPSLMDTAFGVLSDLFPAKLAVQARKRSLLHRNMDNSTIATLLPSAADVLFSTDEHSSKRRKVSTNGSEANSNRTRTNAHLTANGDGFACAIDTSSRAQWARAMLRDPPVIASSADVALLRARCLAVFGTLCRIQDSFE